EGATNLIQQVLNEFAYDSDLINVVVREELNRIMAPEANFDRILVQRVGSGNWEVFLEEASKRRIALSSSGSGLKTIILTLLLTVAEPSLNQRQLSGCIFGFEELENNLHPGMHRRLLTYIQHLALERGATIFLTSHSSLAIDLFSTKP